MENCSPTADQMKRLVGSALARFEDVFTNHISARVAPAAQAKLIGLLDRNQSIGERENDLTSQAENNHLANQNRETTAFSILSLLQEEPGKLKLETVQNEIRKLGVLRELNLPSSLFEDFSPKVVIGYSRRLQAEILPETPRHNLPLQILLLASFCYLREREITDNLVDLLLHLIHRIGSHAEKTVIRQVVSEVKRVAGKQSILLRLAETAVANPNEIIKETGLSDTPL